MPQSIQVHPWRPAGFVLARCCWKRYPQSSLSPCSLVSGTGAPTEGVGGSLNPFSRSSRVGHLPGVPHHPWLQWRAWWRPWVRACRQGRANLASPLLEEIKHNIKIHPDAPILFHLTYTSNPTQCHRGAGLGLGFRQAQMQ